MNDKEYLEGKKVKYAIFQTPSLLFFYASWYKRKH